MNRIHPKLPYLTICLVLQLFLAMGSALAQTAHPVPDPKADLKLTSTTRVTVKDLAGNLLSHASVKPVFVCAPIDYCDGSGIRPFEGRAVETGPDGTAVIEYPVYLEGGWKAEDVLVDVDHPDYVGCRVKRQSLICPPDPVVLEIGATVRLSAEYKGRPVKVQPQLRLLGAESDWRNDIWTTTDGLVLTTNKCPAGTILLRVMRIPEIGKPLFGDTVVASPGGAMKYDFHFKLTRGARVTGRLSGVVATPICNGVVVARVFSGPEPGREAKTKALCYTKETSVTREGTFCFEGLPLGRMELTAVCDGYVSRRPDPAPAKYAQQEGRLPQVTQLTRPAEQIEVPMEPAGACVVHVVDSSGKAVVGAMVEPQLYLKSCDSAFQPWGPSGYYTVFTDASGSATLHNVPPGQQGLVVTIDAVDAHPGMGGKGQQGASADVVGGKITETTVYHSYRSE